MPSGEAGKRLGAFTVATGGWGSVILGHLPRGSAAPWCPFLVTETPKLRQTTAIRDDQHWHSDCDGESCGGSTRRGGGP
jgi:hypothetical protein